MRSYLGLVAALCLASSASATEWTVLGARAMGMGGAGVALAQGPVGSYWNAGGLGETYENPSGVEAPFFGHMAITGDLLQGANDLNQIQKDCQSGGAGFGTCSQANITNALNKLNESNSGVRGDFGGGLNAKLGRLAVFVNDFVYAGAKGSVDMTNTAPATIANNQTALIERGLNVTEFGAGYGHELPFLRGVSAGANLKLMVGRVGYDKLLAVSNGAGSSGSLSNFTKNTAESVQPGIDVGALWDLSRSWDAIPMHPRLAVAARNINDPKFTEPGVAQANGEASKFSLQGNARAGLAISPLHFLNLTADADLTRNLTPADGIASQMVGVGAEINVFNRSWIDIPLRAGLARNVAIAGSKTDLSLGGGLHIMHVDFDVAGLWSPSRATVQTLGTSKSFPSELGVSAQLGVLFGGRSS